MIYNYENMSYLDYSKEIQEKFGLYGIREFSKQFDICPQIATQIIEKYETAVDGYFKKPENATKRIDISMLDPKIVETARRDYIDIFSEGADKDKIAYISLGNIASGKSSRIIDQTLQGFNPVTVDADFIRQGAHNKSYLTYYPGLSHLHKEIDDTERYHKATNQLSKIILRDVAKEGFNLYIPKSTTSMKDLLQNIQDLQEYNYIVNLIQCETDFAECADRNYFRFLRALFEDKNARFVPLSVLKRIDDKTYRVFCTAYEIAKQNNNKTFNEFRIYLNPKNQPLEEIDKTTMKKKFDEDFIL